MKKPKKTPKKTVLKTFELYQGIRKPMPKPTIVHKDKQYKRLKKGWTVEEE